jgi:L-lactate dehydrogenase
MFEQIFAETRTDTFETTPTQLRKGVIIGAGQVGLACAYSMLIQQTLDELVLVDVNQHKLEGEVMDLVHGLPFLEPTRVRAGSFAAGDADGANLVIITAGAKQRPGETRLDLVQRNVSIFKQLIPEVVSHCPKAIFLVVSNPVDIMTYVTWKLSGLPSAQVIGSGTVLDTARFRYLLCQQLQVDPRSIHAYIIGEHGDSEVPVWSRVNVAGHHLCPGGLGSDRTDDEAIALQHIFEQTRRAAYEIIARKGATSYAVGLAVTQIAQAILRNQHRVLTVSSPMHGVYGLEDVCLSLPSVVNSQGVSRIVELDLSPQETELLQRSGQILKDVIRQLQL